MRRGTNNLDYQQDAHIQYCQKRAYFNRRRSFLATGAFKSGSKSSPVSKRWQRIDGMRLQTHFRLQVLRIRDVNAAAAARHRARKLNIGKRPDKQRDDLHCPFSGRILSTDLQGRLTNPDNWPDSRGTSGTLQPASVAAEPDGKCCHLPLPRLRHARRAAGRSS